MSDRELSIVPAATDRASFDRILALPAFAAVEAHPQTNSFGRTYHPAVHGNHDASFAVFADGTPAVICLCAPLEGKASFYGIPLRLIAAGDLDSETRCCAVRSAFAYLNRFAEAQRLGEITVFGEPGEKASAHEDAARQCGATMYSHPVAYVDLTAGVVAWRAALRKSFRSLINWGRRNLSIAYVNKETPDRHLFDRYRDFHAKVAGRVTRSQQSWNVMYDWLAGGNGELVLGFFEGKLMTGTMFIDGTEVSTYSSGVYDRTQFDKPLAHFPIWLGIERAHTRGMKTLQLGLVPSQGTVPEKEYTIGYFKRGFATDIQDYGLWRWAPNKFGDCAKVLDVPDDVVGQ